MVTVNWFKIFQLLPIPVKVNLKDIAQVAGFLRAKLEAEAEVESGLSLDLAVYEKCIAEEMKQLRKVKNSGHSSGIPLKSNNGIEKRKICNSEEDNSSIEIAENSSVQPPQLIASDLNSVGKFHAFV